MRSIDASRSTFVGVLSLVAIYALVVSLRQAVMPEGDASGPALDEEVPALNQVCESQDTYAFAALGMHMTRELQRMLAEYGYYQASLDGCVGAVTQQALYNYQRDNGLAATGAINAPTLTHLGIPVPAWLVHHKDAPAKTDNEQSLTSGPPTP